ncbi:IniB N-terminal domain-containing protein [Nocardia sp. NPDC049707]|uniref:IniB N-terminal domain-containing protein n=1 Tax=Nocardia sp. NPDC049707 TaxID=3154735 RepID=UPI0034304578
MKCIPTTADREDPLIQEMISMTPNAILEFILDLLRDHEAAVGYCANPGQALAAAGLLAVTPEDIAAVAPLVAESALIAGTADLGGHAGFPVTGAASSPVGSTVNTWWSLDVSNAFGSGLDSSAGSHLDTSVTGHSETHAGTDLAGPAGIDLGGDAFLH